MAGESPDKSEQQGSSGESTPAERDPRLSVFREAKTSTDQPTAVFKMPRPAEAADAADALDAESGPTAGDSRLRAAVAAWMATAAEPSSGADGDAGAQDAPQPASAAARAAEDAPAAAGQDSAGAPAPRDTKPSRDAAAEDAGRPAAGADAPESGALERAADAEPGGQRGAEDAGRPAAGKGAPAAREPKPAAGADVDAESADDSPGSVRPKPGTDTELREKSVRGAETQPPTGAGAPAAREPKPAADADADAESSRGGTKTEDAAARPSAGADVPAARASKPAADAEEAVANSRPAAGAKPEAEPARRAEAKDAARPAAGADRAALDDRPEAESPSGGSGDATAKPDRSSGTPSRQKRPAGPAGADAKAVDQATAVFKAIRPPVAKPEQAADQATTAFKAVRPPAAKPEPGADQTASPPAAKQEHDGDQATTAFKAVRPSASAPESVAERTSKFVPLKPTGAQAPARPSAPASPSLGESERTKQQPLPPKPPLDMLAELTNTPPPAPTPVRTAVRRVKIWTPLVVLLAIVFAVVQLVRPLPDPQLSMTAKSTFAFEGDKPSLPWPAKGQAFMAASGLGTVGSSGEQKPVPIASVTKAMTAYVILRDHPLKEGEDGPSIEIDAKGEAEGQLDKSDGESTLNTVKEGDKLSLHDALAAIMIPSANNIARQLARWDAGSEEAFVKKMNEAAKELGMTNTTYTDPSGLNATTVSTAEDQVKLGLELVEIPALMDITKLPEWKDPSGKNWRNWNELVPFDGALGIKTGSTTKAGGNLLFAAHKKVGATDQLIVGAVLAQHDTPILGTAIKASKDIMLATQELLESHVVVKRGDVVGHVDDGLGGTTPVVATKDVNAVGWPGLTVKIELSDGGSAVPHSARAGTEVGTLTVGEGASQVKVPVALQQDLAEPSFGDKLTRVA